MYKLNFIASALLLLLQTVSTAQTPVPFPTENATWCYGIYDGPGPASSGFCMETDGLFTINGNTYTATINGLNSGRQFYREENRKLYLLSADSTTEYLLYDFNLVLGDSFVVEWGWPDYTIGRTYQVYQVDTMITNDGIQRKVISLLGEGFTQWIEGIGDSDWPFLLPNYEIGVSQFYGLGCFGMDNIIVHPPNLSSCGSIVDTEAAHSTVQSIQAFPNPITDTKTLNISIENDYIGTVKIECLSLDGRILNYFEKQKTNQKQIFEFHQIPNETMFFVRVTDGNSSSVISIIGF